VSTVAEIERAIKKLTPEEKQRLRAWFLNEPGQSPWQELRSLAGAAKNLPSDMAANHDHYLHGVEKHTGE
jgi:hypothetical protein